MTTKTFNDTERLLAYLKKTPIRGETLRLVERANRSQEERLARLEHRLDSLLLNQFKIGLLDQIYFLLVLAAVGNIWVWISRDLIVTIEGTALSVWCIVWVVSDIIKLRRLPK